MQQRDRREAEEMQAHDDDGDAGDDRELVRIGAHQRADHAGAGAERDEHGRKAATNSSAASTVSRLHLRLRLGVGEPLQRGAGEIDEIGRHQRQHAGRQEADQARRTGRRG